MKNKKKNEMVNLGYTDASGSVVVIREDKQRVESRLLEFYGKRICATVFDDTDFIIGDVGKGPYSYGNGLDGRWKMYFENRKYDNGWKEMDRQMSASI